MLVNSPLVLKPKNWPQIRKLAPQRVEIGPQGLHISGNTERRAKVLTVHEKVERKQGLATPHTESSAQNNYSKQRFRSGFN